MPDEKGNVTLEITLPQEIYDRVKRLAEDGVQDLFPMPANHQPTTAEEFVGELLIGRLRAFGITADSAEVQILKAELSTKQEQLEKALKPRVVVVQKMADVVVAAVVGDLKWRVGMNRCACGSRSRHRERHSGLGRKPFAFPSESCSSSPRNAFHVHPGTQRTRPRTGAG